MTSQGIEAALAKLKTKIEGITLSPDVSLNPRGSNQIPADKFPAVDIAVGGSQTSYEIVGEYRFWYQVVLRIYSKSGRADIMTIIEQIADALAGDHNLTGSCSECVVDATDPPMIFSGQGATYLGDLSLRLRLRRDYP